MDSIFTNPQDGRPRAGWRLFIQFIVMVILLGLWQIFAQAVLGGWPGQGSLAIILGGIFVVLSIWIAAKLMDRRGLSEYGLILSRHWWKELGAGIGLGFLGMTMLFMIMWLAGWIDFVGWGWEQSHSYPYVVLFIGYFCAMAAVGFYEELLARGYQTKNLAEGLEYWFDGRTAALFAVAGSSVIFGLLHIGNPHASWISTLNITLAGVLLGLPFIISNSLALPIGLHFSWNFFQGGIYGFAVSGNPARESIIQITVEGPEYLSGGRFGPEGGFIGTGVIIFLICLILAYYKSGETWLSVSPELTAPPRLFDPPK